ncbi:MAG: hypothetical protein NUV57_02250 [archaeon]|nr:hypothetical protein [archaeon]
MMKKAGVFFLLLCLIFLALQSFAIAPGQIDCSKPYVCISEEPAPCVNNGSSIVCILENGDECLDAELVSLICGGTAGDNYVKIEITTDKDEYTLADTLITATIVVTRFESFVESVNVTVKTTNAESVIVERPLTLTFSGTDATQTGEVTFDTADLGEGMKTIIAQIDTVNTSGTVPDETQLYDNTDYKNIILNTGLATTATPEIPPVFIVLILISVFLLVNKN